MRLKDTLRIPVSGSLATTRPAVTYGPASFSEWTTRGRRRRSTSAPVLTTSWTGASLATTGGTRSRLRSRNVGTSASGGTPSPRARRRRPPTTLATTGIVEPATDSKRIARPRRSASVISAASSVLGSTGRRTRRSRSWDSRRAMTARRSACIGLEYTAARALRHPAPAASRLAARGDPAGRPRRGGGVRPRVVPERQVHAPRVAAHGHARRAHATHRRGPERRRALRDGAGGDRHRARHPGPPLGRADRPRPRDAHDPDDRVDGHPRAGPPDPAPGIGRRHAAALARRGGRIPGSRDPVVGSVLPPLPPAPGPHPHLPLGVRAGGPRPHRGARGREPAHGYPARVGAAHGRAGLSGRAGGRPRPARDRRVRLRMVLDQRRRSRDGDRRPPRHRGVLRALPGPGSARHRGPRPGRLRRDRPLLPLTTMLGWLGSPQVASLVTNMLEQGFLFGFLGLGVLITFRFFRFPDLTAEGSYPLGGAVVATLLVARVNPFLATGAAVLAGAAAGAVTALIRTDLGLAVRATGENEVMIRALGVDTDRTKILGLGISNGIIALSGALVAQDHGFADIGMGIGVLVTGAAAVLIGEALFGDR